MEKIVCYHCKEDSGVKETGNMGTDLGKSGYYHVFNFEMESFYFCEKCYAKLREHAKEIFKILPDDTVFFPDLLKDKNI